MNVIYLRDDNFSKCIRFYGFVYLSIYIICYFYNDIFICFILFLLCYKSQTGYSLFFRKSYAVFNICIASRTNLFLPLRSELYFRASSCNFKSSMFMSIVYLFLDVFIYHGLHILDIGRVSLSQDNHGRFIFIILKIDVATRLD